MAGNGKNNFANYLPIKHNQSSPHWLLTDVFNYQNLLLNFLCSPLHSDLELTFISRICAPGVNRKKSAEFIFANCIPKWHCLYSHSPVRCSTEIFFWNFCHFLQKMRKFMKYWNWIYFVSTVKINPFHQNIQSSQPPNMQPKYLNFFFAYQLCFSMRENKHWNTKPGGGKRQKKCFVAAYVLIVTYLLLRNQRKFEIFVYKYLMN